ncbi:hypothetical protein MHK_004178 [Candidatus Magnetomorum sp. HK-1]|nr:hypothetical protein MHK_004178 [Candidatus Magnetomorum sp. HK-1]
MVLLERAGRLTIVRAKSSFHVRGTTRTALKLFAPNISISSDKNGSYLDISSKELETLLINRLHNI